MIRKLLILLFFLAPFLMKSQNIVWKTNFNDAIAISNEERKPLLIYFTIAGAPLKIDTEIFKTPDFAVWSRDNVILVKLDLSDDTVSDAIREQNVKIKEAFGVDEMPQVCFAMASVRKGKTTFNALGKMSYKPGGPQSWITECNILLHPE
ncbi:thioredoxin family protein [Flavobacterium sp. MC2016-06]|jgi:hypothetical protein|uniref:thioredoxin family protein n=1 Tax=Flavobacterium sp. MC2016-06 TaxID=2676308 RepID=UPI0012BA9242|nr:thioredoxin family protein [Flavobacterium sp. MC2016-06]MBU3857978.1 thioredoxin family protein [Flavobacterium sp. MC2016-06]